MAITDAELEKNVSEGLNKITDDAVNEVSISTEETSTEETSTEETSTEETSTEETSTEETSTEEIKTEETSTKETSTEEIKTEETSTEEVKTETPGAEGAPSTLPDAFVRAAIHQDWKPDEIKAFYEANPEKALETFSKIHETTNNMSAQWARMGKVALEPVQPESASAEIKPTKFTGVDINKIREEVDDDQLVDSVIVPLNKAVLELTQTLDRVQKTNEQAIVTKANEVSDEESQVMGKVIDQFFTDSNMKLYKDLYGEGGDFTKITQEQFARRMELLTHADRIIAGAALQGENLPNEKAMELAHLATSAPHTAATVRTELIKSIQKRSSGITLQPSGSSKSEGGPKTNDELEAGVAQRLQKAFT